MYSYNTSIWVFSYETSYKRNIKGFKSSAKSCEGKKRVERCFQIFVDDFIIKSLNWKINQITFYIDALILHASNLVCSKKESKIKLSTVAQTFSLAHPSHNTLIKLKQHHVINHNRLLEEKPINHYTDRFFHQ